jgi:hypothetical protein
LMSRVQPEQRQQQEEHDQEGAHLPFSHVANVVASTGYGPIMCIVTKYSSIWSNLSSRRPKDDQCPPRQ